MGAKLCVLCRTSEQDSQSPSSRDVTNLKKENPEVMCMVLKQKMELERGKKVPKVTLEDWILASPGMKPEYVCARNQFKKKVHPLIAEAKDSLCLDRPKNKCDEKSEDMSSNSHKRVTFMLPHTVKFFSPEELSSPEEKESYYYRRESAGSFYTSICREYSFDSSAEEPLFKLAVDVLPHLSVSSKI
ncbi:hypothetical protein Fmac_013688 [Flemingia macrophylla]|uniref:Uncharacterized protein n=1 Tax=Flemingia macrophylla TaxID=520843 RepID=A0ABD1MUP8_9FABA